MSESNPLPQWPRPYFEPSGAMAELFYLVVGPAPEQPLKLSRRRHHLDRIEPELQISVHQRSEDPAWFDAWFQEPLGNQIDGLFADPHEIRSAPTLTIVRGQFKDPPDLSYLRNTLGVVSAIADTPGTLAVFDVLGFTWWRLGDWRAAFVDQSEFQITDHIFIVVTDDERYRPGYWTHTRGMVKFGRPDLQIKHLPGDYTSSNPAIRNSGHVINGVASYLALGALLRDGQTMHIPSADSTIAFIAAPDDSETDRHFNNANLEICDWDEEAEKAVPGIPRLLEKAARGPAQEE